MLSSIQYANQSLYQFEIVEEITFRLSLTRATATLPDDATLFFLLILLDLKDVSF